MDANVRRWAAAWVAVAMMGGCDGDGDAVDAGADAAIGADATVADGGGEDGVTFPACPSDIWQGLDDYDDVGTLSNCPSDEDVAATLFQLGGVTIDNNGTEMTPCISAKCDDTYVYVATNQLPHYDFVQTTPNELVENLVVYRVPRAATPMAESAEAVDAMAETGCIAGYEQYINDPGTATGNEPSGLCANAGDLRLYDTLSTGRADYQAIPCLGGFAFLISGVPTAGPNEAGFPDPWGNPVAVFPETSAGDIRALDLCGGHTANEMHHHSVSPACFERAADNTPANSYVAAAEAWDLVDMLTGACSEESPIVGWSADGYPIKGPCVCMARDASGACTDVRRARSSWLYRGLGEWEAMSSVASGGALSLEGTPCTTADDCDDENFACQYALSEDGSGEVTATRQCVLIDYGWCSHRYVDRTADTTAGIAYLDRCNGTEGADGYAYHTTMSFPYIQGCYRGTPAEQAGGGGGPGGGGPGGGGPGGGGPPGG